MVNRWLSTIHRLRKSSGQVVSVVSGIRSQRQVVSKGHCWPWKIPISQVYLYHIYIIYYNIEKKKTHDYVPMNYWKTLAIKRACIWRFPKSWGYPKIITSSMFWLGFSDVPCFFPRKQLLGYPKRWKPAMASSSKVQGIAHQEDLRDQTIPRQLQLASASLRFLFKDTKFKASILGEYLLYVYIYTHTCIIEIVWYIIYITM